VAAAAAAAAPISSRIISQSNSWENIFRFSNLNK